VLNDQFGGSGTLDEYLERIEAASPLLEAVGVTDYLTTGCYEAVRAAKADGRLPSVRLIFPNVELRLSVGTKKKPLNLHLLVSPDAADHVEQLHRFLGRLHFDRKGDKYACTRDDLIRLGRDYTGQPDLDESAALRSGVNQFKVDFRELREEFEDSTWMRDHALVAVATGTTDGTSGLQDPSASFTTLREELEGFADIVFSGSESQAMFWRGEGKLTPSEMERKYRSLKPCLHGSDAHCLAEVGTPDLDRFTWLKGDPTFESLRQACLEPAGRVFIGEIPPEVQNAERTVRQVATSGASWLLDDGLAINPGLVAIIGARGSGKTALADLLAQGGGSSLPMRSKDSFLTRAQEFLDNTQVALTWSDGEELTRPVISWVDDNDADVHYLTQQFVERLCSSEGASDELLAEIQKVVFSAHEPATRMEATSFDELLEASVGDTRRKREYLRERTDRISQDVLSERQRIRQVPVKKKALEQLRERIKGDKKVRDGIVRRGEKERADYYERLRVAIEARERAIQALGRRGQQLQHLETAIQEHESSVFPDLLERLRSEFHELKFSSDEWNAFNVWFTGDPRGVVRTKVDDVRSRLSALSAGSTAVEPTIGTPPDELTTVELETLKRAFAQVGEKIGIDRKNAQRLKTLNERIASTGLEAEKAAEELEYFEGGPERLKVLVGERSKCYEEFFDLIVAEEAALSELYEPLEAQLADGPETIGRLRLVVIRQVDLTAWSERGEELLDLRKNGEFRGKGSLREFAEASLLPVWETGSATEVAQAMADFRQANDDHLIAQAKVDRDEDPVGFQQWSVDIGRWLYSTDHVDVTYSFEYEESPLVQLSPGTRGIVLLMLYLALDHEDNRPLIIDQPEENLDPRSVFAELVDLFRAARSRRQVIIVTHNANLVVNTDVDQVIVADCQRPPGGGPPRFVYHSGGLENRAIREKVCEILEGGEEAFRQRAKRLRVRDF
jgi:energy-coupling factor transporter ATP-binding protein EcfA2